MKTLLIVAHAPSGNTRLLRAALLRGAGLQAGEEVQLRSLSPFDANAEDVLNAQAVILGTTENFGYMAGATKDFFDRCYYDLTARTDALPYAVYIRAGLDGTGARRAIEKICSGLNWKPVQAPLVLRGPYQVDFESQCETLGAAVAAGLSAGIF